MRIGKRKRQLRRWAVRSLRKTQQRGGFLPLLAPLIPYAIAAATGAATTAGGWGMSKLLHGSARQSRRASRRK
jgi:hypothetical protein